MEFECCILMQKIKYFQGHPFIFKSFKGLDFFLFKFSPTYKLSRVSEACEDPEVPFSSKFLKIFVCFW